MLLFGLAQGCLAILAFLRLVLLISKGQKVSQRSQNLVAELQAYRSGQFALLSPGELVNLEVVIERFSSRPTIRPMDCFNLNLSTGVSLAGLLITYIIVLLQFRIGDPA